MVFFRTFVCGVIVLLGALVFSASCSRTGGRSGGDESLRSGAGEDGPDADLADTLAWFPGVETEVAFDDFLAQVLRAAEIPREMSGRIIGSAAESPGFIMELLICLDGDPFLRRLVDKQHGLPDGYEPGDLVALTGGSYQVSRRGLLLRSAAAEALETMAAAAKAEGVSLIASSAYRSYNYQAEVYARNVRESGQETADRESSRPGYSQHQTGLAVDFGSIDDSFAQTRAGRWILTNGSRFGWSLSFPDGYEEVTGYRWESWHYRYVGPDLASFIDTWFGGVQQYALRFIHEWEAAGGE
jgi:D-alanyl-D-alanine carboxypeptidase